MSKVAVEELFYPIADIMGLDLTVDTGTGDVTGTKKSPYKIGSAVLFSFGVTAVGGIYNTSTREAGVIFRIGSGLGVYVVHRPGKPQNKVLFLFEFDDQEIKTLVNSKSFKLNNLSVLGLKKDIDTRIKAGYHWKNGSWQALK